jgi:hypothetical protein
MNRFDGRALVPPLTAARLARQYEAVRARVRGVRGRRAWAGWALAAAAAIACVVVWVVVRRPPASVGGMEGAMLESGAGQGVHVTLAEGSQLDLAAESRARLTSARPTSVRIDLEKGRVEIEATHVAARSFVVAAGAYEVRVVGTHFVVERSPGQRVTVRVDRGAVEVASATGEIRRLAAGEQWSAPDGARGADSMSAAPSPPPPAPSSAPAAAPSAPPIGVSPAAPSAAHEETAKQLFDEAQQARAEGRPQDAARAFDRLRHGFRRDRRASLASFELGRLRLDVLNDPRGAEEAFRDAIALGPASPFREDAEARRVEALARMGDASGCASARDAYLARWPSGTYRRAVEIYCGAR